MGAKRRQVADPSAPGASYSYVTMERPPAKAPRTGMNSAPTTSVRRFGFKGPSFTKVPPPASGNQSEHQTATATAIGVKAPLKARFASTTVPVKRSGRSHLSTVELANGGSAKVELDIQVRETFASSFSNETVASLEELLAFRPKANKFAVKARKEEQLGYIRQLRAAVRDVVEKVQEFGKASETMDSKLASEKATLERRLAVLQEAARNKEDSELELERLLEQNEELTKVVTRFRASEQEIRRSNTTLQEDVARLEKELRQTQKENDQLQLDLKASQARVAEQAQYYEEKKKELERFYEKKDHEGDQRKQTELEKLQEKLNKAREDMAAAHRELENQRERATTREEELNRERERRTRSEMEKCTLEATNQSLEARISSGKSEAEELKEKVKQKDEEVSNLVKSLTEIQKFSASASTKVEADKKELAEKIEVLQSTNRDLERKEAMHESTIRDLRQRMEAERESKKTAEQSEEQIRVQLKKLEMELQESSRKSSVETGVRQMLEDQMRELRTEHVAVNAQLEATKSEMKRLQAVTADAKVLSSKQIAELEERFRLEKEGFNSQIDKLQEEKVSLESEVKTLRERASTVRDGDLEELCEVKREAEVLRRRMKELSNQGAQSIAQKDSLILELQDKVKQGDKMRRAMHNTIQELRGNVRVFARARPFLPSDRCDPNTVAPVISCDYDGQSLKLRRPAKNASEKESFAFTFDKVFAPSAGQDTVFEEVSEFVQSSLDGYHVCLFSYGQTGSGKTHTMQGSGNGQMRGIIPRAIEKVLHESETLKLQGWNYTTRVSFLEIYNENLNDLLAPKRDGDNKLVIKKDTKGGVYVPDLTLVDVTAIEQVEALMEKASRARSVACTDMNAQSSRSHSVFTLHLRGVNEKDGVMLSGKLNLVDLAGSERASRSNVSGERLKETQAINKSLSCLADVFNAIGNKSSHIPFRNSKLTYLLQSSLSGDGKTLMMVNLSPTLESANESLCSLRFAKQVNQCELGKPKRQIKSRKDHA